MTAFIGPPVPAPKPVTLPVPGGPPHDTRGGLQVALNAPGALHRNDTATAQLTALQGHVPVDLPVPQTSIDTNAAGPTPLPQLPQYFYPGGQRA